MRTTSAQERLNKEIKQRTNAATRFPNDASLLRLASPVHSEISDDRETERAYLTMETRRPRLKTVIPQNSVALSATTTFENRSREARRSG